MARSKRTVKVTGLGNHPKGWEPTARDVPAHAPSNAEVADYGRQEALQPAQSDMRTAFGEPIDEVFPKGHPREGQETGKVRWSIDMQKRENRGRWRELSAARRKVMIERSGRLNGVQKVALADRATGEQRFIPVDMAESVAREGNYRECGRRVSTNIYEGPDGMLWKRAGRNRWWPTGRKCLGTPLDGSDPYDVVSPQSDPSGRLWERNDADEWHEAKGAV